MKWVAKRCTKSGCRAWVCRNDAERLYCVGHYWSLRLKPLGAINLWHKP